MWYAILRVDKPNRFVFVIQKRLILGSFKYITLH